MNLSSHISSHISSLGDEYKSNDYVEPHYKEWYRLAIDKLVDEDISGYEEFLAKEGLSSFLAEEELYFIKDNARKLAQTSINSSEEDTDGSSSGTYWPLESDTEVPDLDMGWPYVVKCLETQTNVELHFHPPREDSPTVKEIVRKLIKNARQVVAIVMDMFTDVDIFKEVLDTAARGVPVYIVLDDTNFKHFTTMCEKQGVHLQRLMNIRIRTVKGLDYLCRSGSKFHGKMMEKFLLVDCKTVVYGTYSFMWSFEKIHLSMVQVITGQLVESYDEEFRTIYARSDIPSMFSTENTAEKRQPQIFQNGISRDIYQHSVKSNVSSSNLHQPFSRTNPTRHTLDTLYQKFNVGRNVQQNEWDNISNKMNPRTVYTKPFVTNHMDPTNRVGRHQAFEKSDYWKRHSYAGEQQETSARLLLNQSTNHRPLFQRSSHNLLEENESIGSSIRGDFMQRTHGKYFEQRTQERNMPNFDRSSRMRNTYHGPNMLQLAPTHKLPTLASMKRTGLRNWRIESYLNAPNASQTNSIIDPLEHKAPSMMDRGVNSIGHRVQEHSELMGRAEINTNPNLVHSRLRASILYKAPQVGEEGTRSHNSESTSSTIGSDSMPAIPQVLAANKTIHSLFNTDKSNSQNYVNAQAGAVLEHRSAALKAFQSDTELNQTSNLQRQHSFNQKFQMHANEQSSAVPTSNMNAAVGRTLSIPALSNMKGNESPRMWRLERNGKTHDQHSTFIRKSSDKIRSLLNISTEKRDHGLRSRGSVASYKTSSSTDTLTSEDGRHDRINLTGNEESVKTVSISSNSSNTPQVARSNQNVQQNAKTHLHAKDFRSMGDESTPRFSTEKVQIRQENTSTSPTVSYTSRVIRTNTEEAQPKINTTKTQHNPSERRVFSRFEKQYETPNSKPTLEETGSNSLPRRPLTSSNNTAAANDVRRSLRLFTTQGNHARPAAPHHENKFEKFMQKFVGTFKPKK
ncbi:protein FAM83B [Leucoraja erinacea]|uniref:protein FAM83B n=1 Tax=Leucoraja erinaceus TaxID=7782 RepID=UPI002457D7F1|nr:protein FAM83B [Leucoraja erinacea]